LVFILDICTSRIIFIIMITHTKFFHISFIDLISFNLILLFKSWYNFKLNNSSILYFIKIKTKTIYQTNLYFNIYTETPSCFNLRIYLEIGISNSFYIYILNSYKSAVSNNSIVYVEFSTFDRIILMIIRIFLYLFKLNLNKLFLLNNFII